MSTSEEMAFDWFHSSGIIQFHFCQMIGCG